MERAFTYSSASRYSGFGAVRHHGDSTARPRYGVTIRSTPIWYRPFQSCHHAGVLPYRKSRSIADAKARILGVCTGRVSLRARPRPLQSSRDRLRRPVPLSRAVRESLPPGRPGEVPRLRARPGLDAGEPGAAHGRLPARLLGPVEDAVRVGGPLRAVPARRPLGMDLLRDRRAVVRAVAAGQREPDPEDALSAPARAAVRGRHPPDQLLRDARRAARPQLRAAPARSCDRVARDPDRRWRRRALVRAGARDRVPERPLPGHRVPRRRAAPAA